MKGAAVGGNVFRRAREAVGRHDDLRPARLRFDRQLESAIVAGRRLGDRRARELDPDSRVRDGRRRWIEDDAGDDGRGLNRGGERRDHLAAAGDATSRNFWTRRFSGRSGVTSVTYRLPFESDAMW